MLMSIDNEPVAVYVPGRISDHKRMLNDRTLPFVIATLSLPLVYGYNQWHANVIVERFLNMSRNLFDEKEMKKGMVRHSSQPHTSLLLQLLLSCDHIVNVFVMLKGSMVHRTCALLFASGKHSQSGAWPHRYVVVL
jgi:hypothetical protein